jgi:uncharacterized membrane-anchored protein YitT (DUF2179 family)
MKVSKATAIQEAKDYVFILIGLFLYALGWTGFLIPAGISTGGATGIGALIFFATGVPIYVSYFSINVVLLLFAIKLFGFLFSLRTVINVFVLTFLLSYLQAHISEPLVHNEPFMNAILGGILCGVGVGLVFNYKGSTGGTDIVAMLINKYFPRVSLGKGVLFSDVAIICCSFLIFHSIEKIVYGLVVMAVSSYAIDMVLSGARQSVQFFIFSSKHEEIADAIIEKAQRGCTVLDGTGWFSKNPSKVVVVMAKKTESVAIFRIVQEIDPKALISQSSVIGIYGNGFDQIKA